MTNCQYRFGMLPASIIALAEVRRTPMLFSAAPMLACSSLRAHDVIGVVGFEVGSEFFVQNLCTLIGAESLWVPTKVRDKAFVTEDEVILGVHKFNVL